MMTNDEDRVLANFWDLVASGAQRSAVMSLMSRVVIERPVEWWRLEQAYVAAGGGVSHHGDCFACRASGRPMYFHHLIWVSHGGSNHPLNLVSICHDCHREQHPWMPPFDSKRGGPMVSVAEAAQWARAVSEAQAQYAAQREQKR